MFDLDLAHGPKRGDEQKIAAILEPPVIEKILKHRGLQPQPPLKAAAPRRTSRSRISPVEPHLLSDARRQRTPRSAPDTEPRRCCAPCRHDAVDIRGSPEPQAVMRPV